MDLTALAQVAYFTSSSQAEEYRRIVENYTNGYRVTAQIVSWIVWAVAAYVISKKAKEIGLNQAAHFCLPFFLHVIGGVVSLILIDKRKKQLYMMGQYGNPNPDPNQQYGQQPYGTQQYGQPYYGQPGQPQDPYGANQLHTCPSCGHTQQRADYCEYCGTKMR